MKQTCKCELREYMTDCLTRARIENSMSQGVLLSVFAPFQRIIPGCPGEHSQNPHMQSWTSHTILTEKVIVYIPFQRDRRNRRYGLCMIRSRCRR